MNDVVLNEAALNASAAIPSARSTDELLEQLMRFLPPDYCGAEDLLAAFAAALHEAEVAYGTLAGAALFGGAAGKWLTLHGHGHGVLRATGETDELLRLRMRSVADQLTPVAIKALVDSVIEPDECRIVEWWDGPYADYEGDGGAWADWSETWASGGPNSFLVVLPSQGDFTSGDYADADAWADSSFAGGDLEPAVYATLINLVQRARAAGVFWRLVLES